MIFLACVDCCCSICELRGREIVINYDEKLFKIKTTSTTIVNQRFINCNK